MVTDTQPIVPPVSRMAYRIDEFCTAYRISRATVYKLMNEGKLRTVLVAGRRLIPVDVANALMTEGA